MERLSPTPSLVIFDIDGTLTDSLGFIVDCITKALRELGVEPPDPGKLRFGIGTSLEQALDELLGDEAPPRDLLLERYRRHAFRPDRAEQTPLFPLVRETLDALRAHGVTMAAATGKGQRGLAETFRTHELAPYFAAQRTADITRPKPHPRMLEEILQELSLEPGEALVVGDTSFDILMANAAGVRSVGVTYGGHPEALLLESGAVGTISGIAELLPLLGLPALGQGIPHQKDR